jgi:hypothetical protein
MPPPRLASGQAGRRAASRRARQALFAAAAAFALVQVGLNLLKGRLDLRDPDFAMRMGDLRRRAAGPGARPRVVVMVGSSRTQWAFRSRLLERRLHQAAGRPAAAFNFGAPGRGVVANALAWHRLRRRGVRPDLLLFEVFPQTLFDGYRIRDLGEILFPTRTLLCDDLRFIRRHGADVRPTIRREWLATVLAPCYYQRLPLVTRVAPWLLPVSQRTGPYPGLDTAADVPCWEMNVSAAVTARRAIRQPEAGEELTRQWAASVPGPRPCAVLAELLDSCRRQGVRVALVLMPESSRYRNACPPAVWRRLDDCVRALSRRHGVPLVHARDWIADNHFVDLDHLDADGARLFTTRLTDEVVLPMLQGRPTPDGGSTPTPGGVAR